jgi:hypothetical protein
MQMAQAIESLDGKGQNEQKPNQQAVGVVVGDVFEVVLTETEAAYVLLS